MDKERYTGSQMYQEVSGTANVEISTRPDPNPKAMDRKTLCNKYGIIRYLGT